MKYLLEHHPEWHELGLAYDCGSSLYTSDLLVFPGMVPVEVRDNAHFCKIMQYSEDITWPNSNEVNLTVVITPVSLIKPPIEGLYLHLYVSRSPCESLFKLQIILLQIKSGSSTAASITAPRRTKRRWTSVAAWP